LPDLDKRALGVTSAFSGVNQSAKSTTGPLAYAQVPKGGDHFSTYEHWGNMPDPTKGTVLKLPKGMQTSLQTQKLPTTADQTTTT
jgi:hypothetical protein